VPLIPCSLPPQSPCCRQPTCRDAASSHPPMAFRSTDPLAVAGLAPTATAPLAASATIAATSWRRLAKTGPSAATELSQLSSANRRMRNGAASEVAASDGRRLRVADERRIHANRANHLANATAPFSDGGQVAQRLRSAGPRTAVKA
jgi:CelD/BcsL family acetyltransferase involved in cellulose biosynthesis